MQQSAVIRTMQQAMSQGDWASAIATGKQWRANGGIHWGITLNLAICLQRNRQGTPEQLSVLADEALRQSRGHPMARLGCAELAISMGRHEQALVLLEYVAGALDSGVNPWPATQLRVQALSAIGRSEEAWEELEQWPVHERTLHWKMAAANHLIQLNAWPEAEEIYRSILAAQPNQAEANHNLGLTLLCQERWQEGWKQYEWRPGNPRRQHAHNPPESIPPLNGLSKTTVVVIGEQGIGDQIMMARYIPTLHQACRRLIVQPAQRLKRLLGRSLPDGIELLGPGELDLPQTEPVLIMGTGSLPLLCWDEDGIKSKKASWRLQPDEARTQQWRQRLKSMKGERRSVGIGWLGGSTGAEQRERAISDKDLTLLTESQDLMCIDLQYLPTGWEQLRSEWAQGCQEVLASPGEDLDETVGLIAALDHVVTTRQTIAHLAGAIGKQASVLVPQRREWRYIATEGSWNWYPNITCVQQHSRGQWRRELGLILNTTLLA